MTPEIAPEFNRDELFLLRRALMHYVMDAQYKRITIIDDWKKTETKLDILLAKKGIVRLKEK